VLTALPCTLLWSLPPPLPRARCHACAAKAVQAADKALTALSAERLKDVLRYHVVPQPVSIPAQLKLGTPFETVLRGHTLAFKETL
jgi:hypothetical protein